MPHLPYLMFTKRARNTLLKCSLHSLLICLIHTGSASAQSNLTLILSTPLSMQNPLKKSIPERHGSLLMHPDNPVHGKRSVVLFVRVLPRNSTWTRNEPSTPIPSVTLLSLIRLSILCFCKL
ncbi:hypothetical protein B0J14DRAFT_6890 [Halenospora varia]|nr:hypothetical protein B0J14DRAFT_6890 [Halenospora varia]